jgi:hypothetical protein
MGARDKRVLSTLMLGVTKNLESGIRVPVLYMRFISIGNRALEGERPLLELMHILLHIHF